MSDNAVIQENTKGKCSLSEEELLAIHEEVAEQTDVEERVAAILERLNKAKP